MENNNGRDPILHSAHPAPHHLHTQTVLLLPGSVIFVHYVMETLGLVVTVELHHLQKIGSHDAECSDCCSDCNLIVPTARVYHML